MQHVNWCMGHDHLDGQFSRPRFVLFFGGSYFSFSIVDMFRMSAWPLFCPVKVVSILFPLIGFRRCWRIPLLWAEGPRSTKPIRFCGHRIPCYCCCLLGLLSLSPDLSTIRHFVRLGWLWMSTCHGRSHFQYCPEVNSATSSGGSNSCSLPGRLFSVDRRSKLRVRMADMFVPNLRIWG
jgi:hypothetical protein